MALKFGILSGAILQVFLTAQLGAGLNWHLDLAFSRPDAIKKVLVDLSVLPEPFSDDRLPVVQLNATRCHKMIGCFEPLPISSHQMDPLEAKTEFLLYRKNKVTTINFEMVENCLARNPSECKLYPVDLQSLISSSYDVSLRTIILVSGYMTKAPTDWEMGAREIWLSLEDVNVIIVGWANGGLYSHAATNTRLVARQITVLLYYLAQLNGFEVGDGSFAERIHSVGHSLGAHIMGFVGMDLGGALGRITGLDPAGPDFDMLHERFRLNRNDAQLVDVVHTNGGGRLGRFGTGLMSGHIDLYANDGVHQPGCTTDLTGCSHGKADKYYLIFLKRELSIRLHLKENYTSLYRMNAYASDRYENFVNATSLLKGCPKSVSADQLSSSDLNGCAIPVDLFSPYSEVRRELETVHGIDFGAESRRNNSYFFYTAAQTGDADVQQDHFLLNARIARQQLNSPVAKDRRTSSKVFEYQPKECDISFSTQMINELRDSYKIEQYHPIIEQNHHKIVAPLLGFSSKFELFKLDALHFRLVNGSTSSGAALDELRRDLRGIFPESITLRGFFVSNKALEKQQNEVQSPGIFSGLKNLFAWFKSEQTNKDESLCHLAIDQLSVRPLRRLRRSLVAHYSLKRQNSQTYPKVVVLSADNDKVPSIRSSENDLKAAETNELLLDTIYIGPLDLGLAKQNAGINDHEMPPADSSTSTRRRESFDL